MARFEFTVPTLAPPLDQRVRLDTAADDSGSSVTDVLIGGRVADPAQGFDLRGVATFLGPDGVDTLYLKALNYRGKVIGAAIALAGVASGGGSATWEAVTIPTDAASYDVAGATGTWDFSVPGEITQTDTTPMTGSLLSISDIFGLAFAVQADITVVAADTATNFAGYFAAGLFNDSGTILPLAGVGNNEGPADAIAFGDPAGGSASPTVPVGETHTYRVIVFGDVAYAYIDGVLFTAGFVPSTNAWGSLPNAQFGFVGVTGVMKFANLKAWRLPVPTLA